MPMKGRRPGIKGRLDALQSHGHQTMDKAQQSMASVEAAVLGLIEELEDGIAFELEIAGKQIPVQLKMLPRG